MTEIPEKSDQKGISDLYDVLFKINLTLMNTKNAVERIADAMEKKE
jgi:hypothetical protein